MKKIIVAITSKRYDQGILSEGLGSRQIAEQGDTFMEVSWQ
jgi:hypothetical protein